MKQNALQTHIGERIRAIRKKKGISLRDFEIMVNIARGELSNIETGKRNITTETIQKIANALECEVSIILKDKK